MTGVPRAVWNDINQRNQRAVLERYVGMTIAAVETRNGVTFVALAPPIAAPHRAWTWITLPPGPITTHAAAAPVRTTSRHQPWTTADWAQIQDDIGDDLYDRQREAE